MGEYYAETEKGTWLYSNRKEIGSIKRFRARRWTSDLAERSLVRRFADEDGTPRCRGNADLKDSQACAH